jgi:hypothetical protein
VGCSHELAGSGEAAAGLEDSALQVASKGAGSVQAVCFEMEEDYSYWNHPPKALPANPFLHRYQRLPPHRAGRWQHVEGSLLESSAAVRLGVRTGASLRNQS